jgi:hypothetical protein
MPSKGFWELNVMDGKNPTHTGGFLTAYDHREFTPEEVAARESAQNSMDAGQNERGATELVFQKLVADKSQKENLIKLLELETLLRPRIEVFEAEQKHRGFAQSLRELFDDDMLCALLIRDYKTCGLGGRWDRYEQHDHFARLVCALNLDDKADENSNSGGSYGLGKTTYAKSSRINTVIYHSVFEPTADTDQVGRRLMGAGVYPKHKYLDQTFGGFAYWGEEIPRRPNETQPFVDEEAEALWEQISACFGVNVSRKSGEKGTDVLILMDSLEIEKIQRAIEAYYFPALLNNDLIVHFIDEQGNRRFPEVLQRPDLDQFVRLYERSKMEGSEKIDSFELANLNKYQGYNIGRIAFEAAEPDEADSSRNNCVAIMRGTGMVINYARMGGDQYEPAVGIFQADKDVHEFLQLAENSAHSEWSAQSRRLHQQHPSLGKKLVDRVNNVVKKRFQDFQRGLQPDVSETRSESGLLARLLTGALSGSKGDLGPDKPFNNPVAMRLTQEERADEKSIWRLRIESNEFTPEESFRLTLFPSIALAGDSKKIGIKHMDFEIKDFVGNTIQNTSRPELSYDFWSGEKLDLYIQIPNPGRHNYLVQCKCVAEGVVQDVSV